MRITSVEELYNFVRALEESQADYDRPLEEYLRSLLGLVLDRRKAKVSLSLFADLVEAAFSATPIPFNKQWMNVVNPFQQKASDKDDFEALHDVLRYQIADLNRFDDGALTDPYRYFGVTSPGGYRWYNFDALTYLECGVAGLQDNIRFGRFPPIKSDCDWLVLARLLELGRIYE